MRKEGVNKHTYIKWLWRMVTVRNKNKLGVGREGIRDLSGEMGTAHSEGISGKNLTEKSNQTDHSPMGKNTESSPLKGPDRTHHA